MSPSRTTKRAARLWLALGACFVSSAALAEAPAPLRVRLEAGSPLSPHSTRIGIFGQTQANCAPNVERVTLDGLDLTIELHVPQSGCGAAGSASFSLHVDPATKAGAPILAGQVYRVRVYSDAGGSSQLAAFRALDTGGNNSNGPTPESGFWWSETTAEAGLGSRGTGISLEAQDDRLALSLFGFADAGNAAWYFGSTRLKGRVAVVSLVELDNGDPLFAPTGSQPEAQAGPRIEVEFVSPTRARAWLVRSENGRDTAVRALALSRSRFAPGDIGASWNGRWVLVADDESAPRQFEFAASARQDADNFHLIDTDNGANLDCRSTVAGALPDLCTLSIGASVLADFDQIGMDHLDGRGKLGAAAKLVRVPR